MSKKDQLIHTFSNNNFIFLDEQSQLDNINISLKSSIYFIVSLNANINEHSFNFLLPKNINPTIYFFCLSDNDNKQKYLFNFDHDEQSNLNFISKVFLNNKSSINIDTTIAIKKNKIKVNSNQQVSGFLFSDDCSLSATPALIVDTNNINASHAVNIGYFNEDKIFYLQAKGLDRKQAIEMLIINEIAPLLQINNKENNYIYNIVHKTILKML